MAIGAVERDEAGRYECVVVYYERVPDEPMMGAEHFQGEGFEADLARAKKYAQEELGEQFLHEASLDEELSRRARGQGIPPGPTMDTDGMEDRKVRG